MRRDSFDAFLAHGGDAGPGGGKRLIEGMDGTLDPTDWPGLRAQGHRMLDDLFDHLQSLRDQPAWRPIPEAVRARHRTTLPMGPAPVDAVHDIFKADVLPYGGGNLHPGFMGWVQGAGTPVGLLAELLAAGLDANCGGRDHMPIAIEQEVAGWMRQLFGFPDGAVGLFVTGASMANFVGVLLARHKALGHAVREQGLAGADGGRLVAYASVAAHNCVPRAMEMAGLGRQAMRMIPVDDRQRIDLTRLRERLAADRSAGLRPFLIVGNAGTVDAGGIDDLAVLADLAAEEGSWLHIDGAYGALGMLAPALAPRLAGIERADSIAFDFHKWGQAPYDAGYILARDGALQYDAFAKDVHYLQRETRGLAGGDWWPCDYGPDLSRGFRALKVWFTFKTLGADAIGASIARSCELGRRLAEKIAATPALELMAPVQLNIVCFRFRCTEPDTVNARIVADLHEAGRVAPSLTRIDGRVVIRAALFNHRTDERDLDALIDGVCALGVAAERAGAA
jgi:aromatic-L-amino-acid/L-tryptophan decarboxylase